VSILAWIIVGLIAGWLAKMVVPGEVRGGLLGSLVVGVIGAFIGGWIWNFFGHTGATGINFASIIVAFVGSVILLLLVRLFTSTRAL